MRRRTKILAGFLLLVFLTLYYAKPAIASDQNPPQITIGFIPGEGPELLKKNGIELAKLLQQKIGIPVNIYISKNYQGLVDAMTQKKIDFAFFSAVTYVFAEKQAGAKVLLKKVWDGPFYYSVLVTKNPKIKKVEDLKAKTIAFVDEKSASGYLYPKLMLKKKNIDPDKFFKKIIFSGSHDQAIRAVVNGQADAAAIYSDSPNEKKSAWKRYSPETFAQQRLLWASGPIPNDPFCVRQDFYDKFPRATHDLMFALIELDDEQGQNLLLKLLNVNEMQTATSRHYDPVRELVHELNLRIDQ